MITTNLTGNLGNHMWFYSICRIVAEKLNYQWGVNPIPTHDYYQGMNQMYFMDVDFGEKVIVNGKNERGLNTYHGVDNEYYDEFIEHKYLGDGCCINMYDPNVFNVSDNTMIHITSQSEDYLNDRRLEILDWFKIKKEYSELYESKLKELGIILDDDLCVINFRGGEYRSVQNLICSKKYWSDSILHMKGINPRMKFLIITDDPSTAIEYIGNFQCLHIDIGFDFYTINKSKYVILSNSSFGWWAAWLNVNSNLIIAPKYWGRHNISNGYWSLGDSYSRYFMYMDRDGQIYDYESCKREALEFYRNSNLL